MPIKKVIEKHLFDDAAGLRAYYGVRKVRKVFDKRKHGPATNASVARMLPTGIQRKESQNMQAHLHLHAHPAARPC
jgi:hypothetical protein